MFVHGHREGLFHMLRILWLIEQHRWEPSKAFTGTLWAIYPQSACQKGSKFGVIATAAPTPTAPSSTEAVSDSITAFNHDAGPPMAPQQETDTFSLLPTCSGALIGAVCQTEGKKPDVVLSQLFLFSIGAHGESVFVHSSVFLMSIFNYF